MKKIFSFSRIFAILTLLFVGLGSAWADTFTIDFYDAENLTTTSGTGLTSQNYAQFVTVPAGQTATDVVTGVTVSGTARFGMNGGLTLGTGTAAADQVTFSLGTGVTVTSCTAYATLYDSGIFYLNGVKATGSMGDKNSAIEDVTPITWTSMNATSLVFTKKTNDSKAANCKRLTLLRVVCEYTIGGGDDSGDDDDEPTGATTTWELVTSSNIVDGQYIIVAKPDANTRVLLNGAQATAWGGASAVSPLTLSTGNSEFTETNGLLTITTAVDPSFTITETATSGQYNIKGSNGTWLGGSAGGGSFTTNQSNWVFEPKADGKMWIRVYAASMTRAILYRSTPTFQHYATSNETSNGYGSVYLYRKVVAQVPVSAAGYATYYNATEAYIMPEGLEGIVVYAINGNTLELRTWYDEGEVVPAGEPLILHGAEGSYTLYAGETDDPTLKSTGENLLSGTSTADEYTEGGEKYYRLSQHNGQVGFYYGAADGAAFQPGANKAYLAISGLAAPAHFLFEDTADVTTSVESVEANENAVKFFENGNIFIMKNGVVYNVLGTVVR